MNDPLQFVWSLVQINPAVLAVLAALFVGYVLKLIPSFPNQRIPLLTISVSAGAYLFLCVPPADAHADKASFFRYLIATLILGCVIGMFAWLFHAQLLKRIEQKIPFVGDALKDASQTETRLK